MPLEYDAILNDKISACEVTLTPVDNRRLMNLCGRFDEHLRQIETRMGVEINNRGNHFQILGEREAVHLTHNLLNRLYYETENGHELTPAQVHLSLQECQQELPTKAKKNLVKKKQNQENNTHEFNVDKTWNIQLKRTAVKPKSQNQRQYIENILSNDINFGVGPAGTGKTFLAVACAIAALEIEKVRRILLVRPAVEAGEKLGFLPGDLSQKIDPYLRPLYDALYEMIGFERVAKLIERNVIEIAPLAYMRGRTLNESFIILDESQNTTPEQMKMFLTRIGFGSTAVINGDITQIDLPNGAKSGLIHGLKVLKKVPGISVTEFGSKDVVRHQLVQQIIEAYSAFESKSAKKGESNDR